MPTMQSLLGMWRRLSLERPGETPDLTSSVHWLQGPRFFVDLRQPNDPPEFAGIGSLRQLQGQHLAWLATQQGFAGALRLTGDTAWWDRRIDFQPPSATPDRARLEFAESTLEERGTEASYLERWERLIGSLEPAYGLALTDPTSTAKGYLVRVGSRFMYIRARAKPLCGAGNLAAILDATTGLTAKQDLLDCEISLGRIDAEQEVWRIERSSLPFRQGAVLGACLQPIGDRISINDIDCHGAGFVRCWVVGERDSGADACPQHLAAFEHVGGAS